MATVCVLSSISRPPDVVWMFVWLSVCMCTLSLKMSAWLTMQTVDQEDTHRSWSTVIDFRSIKGSIFPLQACQKDASFCRVDWRPLGLRKPRSPLASQLGSFTTDNSRKNFLVFFFLVLFLWTLFWASLTQLKTLFPSSITLALNSGWLLVPIKSAEAWSFTYHQLVEEKSLSLTLISACVCSS